MRGQDPEPMVWHDEADRLATWGTLDPPDACMCRDCVLGDDWTVTSDRTVSPDAVRWQPDPARVAQLVPRPSAAGGTVSGPTFYAKALTPTEVASRFGYQRRPSLLARLAAAPSRVLEYLWLWHYNRTRRLP